MGKMHPLFPRFVEAWKKLDDPCKLEVVRYALRLVEIYESAEPLERRVARGKATVQARGAKP